MYSNRLYMYDSYAYVSKHSPERELGYHPPCGDSHAMPSVIVCEDGATSSSSTRHSDPLTPEPDVGGHLRESNVGAEPVGAEPAALQKQPTSRRAQQQAARRASLAELAKIRAQAQLEREEFQRTLAAQQKRLLEDAAESQRKRQCPPPPAKAASPKAAGVDELDTSFLVEHALAHTARPYRCLGLPIGAAPELVRKRYIELAKRLHPDKAGPHPQAQAAFTVVKAAFNRITGASA